MTSDSQRLEQLFRTHHALVTVQTFEEEYVLTLLRELAVQVQCELWTWSATDGLREGLLSGSAPLADTEHAAAVLYLLAREQRTRGIYVMLDLAPYLKDECTLRCLRDAVEMISRAGSQIVLVHASDAVPPVVSALAAPFVPSLPDCQEIEGIIRSTLRQLNEEHRIAVHVTRPELQTIVRNLQGLTRRQARQVIRDAVSVDSKFDIGDMNCILAEKRQAIGGDGILEYVESPINLDEIGGLARVKSWLDQRQHCMSEEAVAFGITPPRES